MSAPSIQTGRLILRKFTPRDMEALFQILKDEEVNTFLPWYPVRTMAETVRFYEERFASNA
ncbi:GNAT family N-acetyltransferase, partial [uncultured Dubosiella sp.]